MYPFPHTVAASERLWERVAARVPWVPRALTWHADLHASWRSPAMVVGHTCGWPLVSGLAGRPRVLGTFEHDIPEAEGPTYRSLVVATRAGEPADFAGATAAVNSTDSLSGWVSLLHAVHGAGAAWQGEVVLTGAHVESLRAMREGSAEIASIDAVTWAHVRRIEPGLIEQLHVVGHGPRVPCLPVIGAEHLGDDAVAEVRAAFVAAVDDPTAADDRAALLVRRFVPMDLADYLPLRALAPAG